MKLLTQKFYNRSSLLVAKDLLGKILVRKHGDEIISGRIVETEAYLAFEDEAAHSYKGKTKRNESLFKDAGHAYVHTIHNKNCLDVVTQGVDVPTSVLIRALEPLEGIELMKINRDKESLKDLTNGPGKLCQALNITRELDGILMTTKQSEISIYDDGFNAFEIITTTRVGISKAANKPYRFYIKGSPFVSKK